MLPRVLSQLLVLACGLKPPFLAIHTAGSSSIHLLPLRNIASLLAALANMTLGTAPVAVLLIEMCPTGLSGWAEAHLSR